MAFSVALRNFPSGCCSATMSTIGMVRDSTVWVHEAGPGVRVPHLVPLPPGEGKVSNDIGLVAKLLHQRRHVRNLDAGLAGRRAGHLQHLNLGRDVHPEA